MTDDAREEEIIIARARATLLTHLPLLVGTDWVPRRDRDGRLLRDSDNRLVFEIAGYPRQDAHVGPSEAEIYLYEGSRTSPAVWVVRGGEVMWYVPPLDRPPS